LEEFSDHSRTHIENHFFTGSIMGFEERYAVGSDVENRFLQAAEKRGCVCRREGTESRQQSDGFKIRLRGMADEGHVGAKRLRYHPDFLCLTKDHNVVYFDAKAGHSIERHSYEEMLRREKAGESCWFAYLRGDDLVCSRPSEIVFLLGHLRNPWNIPIEDGVWRCPRKVPEARYQEWKAQCPRASGTDCALIDLAQTVHRVIAEKA
jgi:hypothetical protein